MPWHSSNENSNPKILKFSNIVKVLQKHSDFSLSTQTSTHHLHFVMSEMGRRRARIGSWMACKMTWSINLLFCSIPSMADDLFCFVWQIYRTNLQHTVSTEKFTAKPNRNALCGVVLTKNVFVDFSKDWNRLSFPILFGKSIIGQAL